MEALLFDLRVPAPSETALLNASGLEDYLHQHTLSADDLRDHLRLFERHCERLDQALTQEQEEKHFARFCSLIQESLLLSASAVLMKQTSHCMAAGSLLMCCG